MGAILPRGYVGQQQSNSPTAVAERNEADRNRQIAATTDRINQIYDSPQRQAQYADFINALRTKLIDGLNRQKVVVDRQNKFATARAGLTGGSRDVDSKRQIGEQYQEGVLGAEDKAQGSLRTLKAQDDSARLGLIGMANGGLDATTAASRALASQRQGIGMARDQALQGGIGDFFSNFADSYNKKQQADAFKNGFYSGSTPFGKV